MVKSRNLILLLILSLNFTILVGVNNLIVEVDIIGNINVQDEFVISALSFEVGDIFNETDVSNSIKTLYGLKIFKDIFIEKEIVTHGIKIIINVAEYPIVTEIKFENNHKISDDKILEVTGIKEGLYWADFMESEYSRLIQDEYTKKRYNFIQINYIQKEISENQISLTIDIAEGEKTRVKNITFYGNKTIASKQIYKKMKTKEAGIFRSGKFIQETFEEDLAAIISFYHKEGYIDAQVISHQEKMVDEKNMHIDIYLFEGNKFKIGNINVKGNSRFTDEILLDNFKYKTNDTFDMQKFDIQLNQVRALYFEEGYIYAQITDDIVKTNDKVDVYINVTENTRAKVRKINITGNRRTKEKVIRRMLRIHPGDYFQRSKVMASQQNIYNMGVFEPDMGIDYNQINSNGDIDLNIDLSDKSSGSANGGVGYNTENNLVGQFSISHNNLLGNGWKVTFKTEFGGEYQSFDLDFTNPYFYDTHTLIGAKAYHTLKDWS
ncbi:MAG: outer membrane protein assembly factor BamA [Candidatus Cloacimonadota bacterium]|nr:outer membrane protein assembly factor BamA [Candidatus Cloacimonadota bacterium]